MQGAEQERSARYHLLMRCQLTCVRVLMWIHRATPRLERRRADPSVPSQRSAAGQQAHPTYRTTTHFNTHHLAPTFRPWRESSLCSPSPPPSLPLCTGATGRVAGAVALGRRADGTAREGTGRNDMTPARKGRRPTLPPPLLHLLLLVCVAAGGWSGTVSGAGAESPPAGPPAAAPRFIPQRIPLQRDLASYKMLTAARSGHAGFQRLVRANAHGARLNRAERRRRNVLKHSQTPAMRPLSAAADSIPEPSDSIRLTGCPFADFTAPVRIGGRVFNLIVDTGSATLALAGGKCTNCGAVQPRWEASASSAPQDVAVSGSYGGGTGWRGQSVLELVSIDTFFPSPAAPAAAEEGDNSTLPSSTTDSSSDSDPSSAGGSTTAASMRVAVILQQSTPGKDQFGGVKESASDFFFANPCADDPASLRGQIVMQGILGMGFSRLAAKGTDAFFPSLMAAAPQMPPLFALEMCTHSGTLWLGGADPDSYSSAELLYTPILSATYWVISPANVFVGGRSLGFFEGDWSAGVNIMDSGTTLWYVRVHAHSYTPSRTRGHSPLFLLGGRRIGLCCAALRCAAPELVSALGHTLGSLRTP